MKEGPGVTVGVNEGGSWGHSGVLVKEGPGVTVGCQ